MTKLYSMASLLILAAVLTFIPVSPQVTSHGVELKVDTAESMTYRRARVTSRRVHRRGYRYTRRAIRRGAYYGGGAAYYGTRCRC